MSKYDTTISEIKRNILTQKTIYKFRNFMYSINKDIRHQWFDMCKSYLVNERDNPDITVTEMGRLQALITHWEWGSFETTSTNWWYILSMNHAHSLTLMTLLRLWIDDIEIFDPEAFETSTIGLR